MEIFKKIIYLILPSERKYAAFLFIMMAIMSILDMLGIASIIPFISVIIDPNLIETNLILNKIFQFFNSYGFTTNKEFIVVLGIGMFVVLMVSISFKAITTYLQLRFAAMREYSISKRLIEGYMAQPYSWILHHHSSEIGAKILSESASVASRGVMTMMNLFSKSLVVVAILVLLCFVEIKLTLIVGLTVSIAYLVIYKLVSNALKIIGNERVKNNKLRFFFINEAFSATKEIKIGGLEGLYINNFTKPQKRYSELNASMDIISELPRYALEAILFGGITALTIYLYYQSGTYKNIIPLIALYAFAGYRLMPAIQQIYNSFVAFKTIKPSLDILYDDLKNFQKNEINENKKNVISFEKSIVLNNVNYEYPKASRIALKNINLTIPAKTKVAIVGATGSGKTTIVDIILSLLEPQQGRLEIDGKILDKANSRDWQSCVGYVPQQIYLSDDTIAANIAFGTDPKKIDFQQVENVSKVANLYEFIVNELPLKYDTKIGERGARLSGGQRQRIGIARALYHKPKLLIMDEGTSALDSLTEKAVMEAVDNLNKDITVIIIAHRLNIIKKCDEIFFLEDGELIDSGSYKNLMENNKKFQLFNLSDR